MKNKFRIGQYYIVNPACPDSRGREVLITGLSRGGMVYYEYIKTGDIGSCAISSPFAERMELSDKKISRRDNSFYMLYAKGGNPPKAVHANYEVAKKEAERLLNTGAVESLYVLKAVKLIKKQTITIEDLGDDYE